MILIATQNFRPDVGGIQAYVTGLADSFASRGYAIAVFCDSMSRAADRKVDCARSYPIYRFSGPKPWRRWRKGLGISDVLGKGDVDVLIADTWKSLEPVPEEAFKNVQVLCLAHGAEFLAAPESTKGRRIAKALGKSHLVAANSQFTAELVAPFLSGKTALKVLWPGVQPPSGASPEPFSPRAPNTARLLTIARLDPYKGVDTVVQTIPALRQLYPDLIYDVVGDGTDRARLMALTKSLGVQSAVHFHGQVSESQKADLLRKCSIFVLPNRREPGEVEGFGIVLLEAAAFGVPAIAGMNGGTQDAVLSGQTGVLVDGSDASAVRDALIALLSDREATARMGQAAHDRFWSEFAWPAAIHRFEAALLRLRNSHHSLSATRCA